MLDQLGPIPPPVSAASESGSGQGHPPATVPRRRSVGGPAAAARSRPGVRVGEGRESTSASTHCDSEADRGRGRPTACSKISVGSSFKLAKLEELHRLRVRVASRRWLPVHIRDLPATRSGSGWTEAAKAGFRLIPSILQHKARPQSSLRYERRRRRSAARPCKSSTPQRTARSNIQIYTR